MKFYDDIHKNTFIKTIKRRDKNNFRLMSAIYLLTANRKLWSAVGSSVKKNTIFFNEITLGKVSETAYILFCGAKDMYFGTRIVYLSDLADRNLISDTAFNLICNTISIRRFGIGPLKERSDEYDKSNYSDGWR